MRILCIGDPHFKTQNIAEVELFIIKIVELAKQQKPDLIVILGDLLHDHEKLHIVPMNKAISLIDQMRKIAFTIVLVGNHDMINHHQYLNSNHWMNGLKEWENVIIVDKVVHYKHNQYNIVCVPFVAPGKFVDALNTCEYDWTQANIVFAHQEFKGCSMSSIQSKDGDDWKREYPFVLSGHIHDRQYLYTKNEYKGFSKGVVFYPGSAFQQAYGESSKRCIPLVDLEKKTIKEFHLDMPIKRTIHTTIEELNDLKIKDSKNTRIHIHCDIDKFKNLKKTKGYKELINSGVKISHKITNVLISNKNTLSFKQLLRDNIRLNSCALLDYYRIVENKPKNYELDQIVVQLKKK